MYHLGRPGHARHVERCGAPGADLPGQVGLAGEEGGQPGRGAQQLVHLGVSATCSIVRIPPRLKYRCTCVDRSGDGVVVLVLPAHPQPSLLVPLDAAAVDAGPHRVGVRVEPLAVRLARGTVLLLHGVC